MNVFEIAVTLDTIISHLDPLRLSTIQLVSKTFASSVRKYQPKDKYINVMELRVQYPKLKYKKKISGASIIHYMITTGKSIEKVKELFPHSRYIHKHTDGTSLEFNMLVALHVSEYFVGMSIRQISSCCDNQWVRAINLCTGIANLKMKNNINNELYRGLKRYYRRFEDTENNTIGYLGVWNINTQFINYLLQQEPDLNIDDDAIVEPSIRLTGKLIRRIPLTNNEIEMFKKYWSVYYCSYTGDVKDVSRSRLKKIGVYAPIYSIEQMIIRRPDIKDIFITECRKKNLLHRVNAILKL